MSDEATIRAKKSIRSAIILAGGMLVGTALLTLANKVFGWIDGETATRGVMALIGMMLVVVGNGMRKQQDGPPSQTISEITTRQSITRVGGWAMILGGLIWTGLWILAPRDLAQVGSVAAVGAAVVVMIVYTIWRYQAHRRSSAN